MLDPRTAHANWSYGEVGFDCVGRVACWFDPTGEEPAVSDVEMWDAWPALHDQWAELKTAAYGRCQRMGEATGESPDALPYGCSFGGLFGLP